MQNKKKRQKTQKSHYILTDDLNKSNFGILDVDNILTKKVKPKMSSSHSYR